MIEIDRVNKNKMMRTTLLVINCIILAIGSGGGPLMLRLYFVKGGQSIWLSSWLQTAGFPILFIPLISAYFHRLNTHQGLHNTPTRPILMDFRIFTGAAVIGILTGVDNYFYGYGIGRLPVSTSTIITATQLAFTAIFAFLIVKQKFNAFSFNAVALLTVGPVVLGLHGSGDRPAGESEKLYILGFVMTVLASALYGLILPLVERMYKKAKQAVTYGLVLEIQVVISLFATLFSTIGMLVNHDFQAMRREAKEYELGEAKYYVVIFWIGIILQCYFLGSIGVVFCASSLVSGIVIAICIPITEILAVIVFHENFTPDKGVALALSLWGFASYFYGEIQLDKKKAIVDQEEDQDTTPQPRPQNMSIQNLGAP